MGSPSDTTLQTDVSLRLSALYKRTDVPETNTVVDDYVLRDVSKLLNGAGQEKVNLLYHKERTLVNSTELINVDGGIVNLWGETLNYDSIKIFIVRNRQTQANRYLQVNFKNDQYYIGPKGLRYLLEPMAEGLTSIVSSGSAEEGNIVISSNSEITYDITIIGSHAEQSSSSGS